MQTRYRTATKFAGRAARKSANLAGKAAVGLTRWAATDHTGTAKFLTVMPPMGFLETSTVLLVQLIYTLLGIAVSVTMFLLLFTFGLSWLFGM